MNHYYNVEQTAYGFILSNANEKFVLNRSKIFEDDYHFYLKRVEPTQQFISGMFRKKNRYVGKTTENSKVVVTMFANSALIVF